MLRQGVLHIVKICLIAIEVSSFIGDQLPVNCVDFCKMFCITVYTRDSSHRAAEVDISPIINPVSGLTIRPSPGKKKRHLSVSEDRQSGVLEGRAI